MKKSILLGLGACALALGGVAALVGQKGAVETKAEGEKTFYLDCTGFSTYDDAQSVCIHAYKEEGDVNTWKEATKVGDNYWYVTLDVTGYTGVEWYRCESGNPSSHFNKQSWLAFPSENYYYSVTGWNDPGDNVNWSAPASWSLTGSSSESLSTFKFDGDGLQYYGLSVELNDNDIIQFTNGSSTSGFADLRDVKNGQTAKEKGLVVDDGTGKVKVLKGGSYDIYVNAITGKVWMQQDAATEAGLWGEEFLATGCTTASTGTKAMWGSFATSYASLTEGAKSLLLNEAHVDHDAVVSGNVALAVQRYDYVLQRYGQDESNTDALGYQDFIGRISAGKLSLAGVSAPFISETKNGHTESVLVTIISIAAVVSIGSLVWLRRRKEN